jgi:hypothetical protein
MEKKSKPGVLDPLPSKENISINEGKIKNGTIAKIKKMKHIDCLEL